MTYEWNGNEDHIPYVFAGTPNVSSIIEDHQQFTAGILKNIPKTSCDIISSYLIQPEYCCVLECLRMLSNFDPLIRNAYMHFLKTSKYEFGREEFMNLCLKISQLSGLSILLYEPKTPAYYYYSKPQNHSKIRIFLGSDTVYFSWLPRERPTSFENLHSLKNLFKLDLIACFTIGKMFDCDVIGHQKEKNKTWRIENARSRTSSEAAQRVLLHYLIQTNRRDLISYRMDPKKKFSKAIDRFDSLMSSVPFYIKTGTAVDLMANKELPKYNKTVFDEERRFTDEEVDRRIDEAKERHEMLMMAGEESYQRDLKKYFDYDIVLWKKNIYECLRELKIMNLKGIRDEIRKVREFPDPVGNEIYFTYNEEQIELVHRRGLPGIEELQEEIKRVRDIVREDYHARIERGEFPSMTGKTDEARMAKHRMRQDPRLNVIYENTKKITAIRNFFKKIDEKNYTDEEKIKIEIWKKKADFKRFKRILNLDVEKERKLELASSPSYKTVYVEKFIPIENPGKKKKSRKERMVIDYISVLKERKQDHIMRPKMPDNKKLVSALKDEIERIEASRTSVIKTRADPYDRVENLEKLREWWTARDRSKDVIKKTALSTFSLKGGLRFQKKTDADMEMINKHCKKLREKDPRDKRVTWRITKDVNTHNYDSDFYDDDFHRIVTAQYRIAAACPGPHSGRRRKKITCMIGRDPALAIHSMLSCSYRTHIKYFLPANVSKMLIKNFKSILIR